MIQAQAESASADLANFARCQNRVYQENMADRGHVRYDDVRLILKTSINNAIDLQPTQASHLLSL